MIDEMEVIYAYTRAQALEDGTLVDVSEMAKEAGWRYPVALTAALYHDIETIPEAFCWEDVNGRLWDVLWMGMLSAKRVVGSTFLFTLILHTEKTTRLREDHPHYGEYTVKAVCGPGDDMEPVVTMMLPEED